MSEYLTEASADFVEVIDTRTGALHNPPLVPRAWLDDPILGRFIEPTPGQRELDGTAAVPDVPDTVDGAPDGGRPTEEWRVAQIESFAEAASIDLAGHKGSKADMVAHINEVLDTPPPPPGDGDTTDTPAAGDTQE